MTPKEQRKQRENTEKTPSTETGSPEPLVLLPEAPPERPRRRRTKIPPWASKPAPVGTPSPLERARLVTEAIRSVHGPTWAPRDRGPYAAKTEAEQVVGLWAAQGHPDLAQFVETFGLVARAARLSPSPVFRRTIRFRERDGSAPTSFDSHDRSRVVATLCRREKWDERVAAASAWVEGGSPICRWASPWDSERQEVEAETVNAGDRFDSDMMQLEALSKAGDSAAAVALADTLLSYLRSPQGYQDHQDMAEPFAVLVEQQRRAAVGGTAAVE